jgi:5'-deoxynucleotidase YfbR-like HD superfamily hydrolase
MELNDILRASFVKRWIITPTTREQSLADHTFNVVMIARAIAKKLDIDDVNIMKAAIVHDLDEIMTGDLPTPLKRKAMESGYNLSQLYETVTKRELRPREETIVHLADRMEAIWFMYNFKAGQIGNQVEHELCKSFYLDVNHLHPEDPELADAARYIMEEICSTSYTM